MENTKRKKVAWRAAHSKHVYSENGHYSARLLEGTLIEVQVDTYDQRFNVYLNNLGIQRTTRSQIMGEAEREWQAYYRLMDAFAEDIQQWLTYRGRGIIVL